MGGSPGSGEPWEALRAATRAGGDPDASPPGFFSPCHGPESQVGRVKRFKEKLLHCNKLTVMFEQQSARGLRDIPARAPEAGPQQAQTHSGSAQCLIARRAWLAWLAGEGGGGESSEAKEKGGEKKRGEMHILSLFFFLILKNTLLA